MKRKTPEDTKVFHYHDTNPKGKKTNDCVIRAISAVTNKTWDEIFIDLSNIALKYKITMDDSKCFERYLKQLGFVKHKALRKADNTRYTGREFCEIIPNEIKELSNNIIANIGSHHITAIIKGKIYDTWDCSDRKIGNYWTLG